MPFTSINADYSHFSREDRKTEKEFYSSLKSE
jgi:hypothetical protein